MTAALATFSSIVQPFRSRVRSQPFLYFKVSRKRTNELIALTFANACSEAGRAITFDVSSMVAANISCSGCLAFFSYSMNLYLTDNLPDIHERY